MTDEELEALSDDQLEAEYDEAIQWRDWGYCEVIHEERLRRRSLLAEQREETR